MTFALSKIRTIEIDGDDPLVIEDRFDSVGNLISKRARRKGTERWTHYGDLGKSLFPMFIVPGFLAPYP